MRCTTSFLLLVAALSLNYAATVDATMIDMDDPLRALGRQDDVRIDAQLLHETVSPGAPIAVTYQIQNFTSSPVAVADKVATASYDPATQTITLSLGSEVPPGGVLPKLVTIEAGEKRVFRASATPSLTPGDMRAGRRAPPRYVQVKVSILRNLQPFMALIRNQSRAPQTLSDELFDSWFESQDTIFLNAVPIQFSPSSRDRSFGADRSNRGSF